MEGFDGAGVIRGEIYACRPQGWKDIVSFCQELLAGNGNTPTIKNGERRAAEGIMLGAALLELRKTPWANIGSADDVKELCSNARQTGYPLIAFHHAAIKMMQAPDGDDAAEKEEETIKDLQKTQENTEIYVSFDEMKVLLTHFHPNLPAYAKDKICETIRKPSLTLEFAS